MTGPRQPQTCSHPIYAQTLTEQPGIFSLLFFCINIHRNTSELSIGTLESNSLSLSTKHPK